MLTLIGTIVAFDTTLNVLTAQYKDGTPAVVLEDSDGEPWATLSVNIPGAPRETDEILVKTWSENEMLREPLLASGLFEDTGRRVPAGFAQAEVWRRTTRH
jgi:hypothetical protein